ncbi:hypothetical protein TNCV_3913371 [Trichonephila clavipes]|nr:hypothetical protein TNCV_3913371 [Trichonephila clavipes]
MYTRNVDKNGRACILTFSHLAAARSISICRQHYAFHIHMCTPKILGILSSYNPSSTDDREKTNAEFHLRAGTPVQFKRSTPKEWRDSLFEMCWPSRLQITILLN